RILRLAMNLDFIATKPGDVIRSLPVRSASGLPVHVTASQPLHSRLSSTSQLWKPSLAAREWVRRRGCRLGFRWHLGGHNAIALLQAFHDFGDNAVADSGFDLHWLGSAARQNVNPALAGPLLTSTSAASGSGRRRP